MIATTQTHRRFGAALLDTGAVVVDEAGRPVWSFTARPPAVVLGQCPGERPVADLEGGLDLRGAGLRWPPAAAVDPSSGSARFPLPIAWAMLSASRASRWSWTRPDGEESTCEPAEAVGAIAAQLGRQAGLDRDDEVVLVVPNDLGLDAQEDLLRVLRSEWPKVQLLWRPVASALGWLEQHEAELLPKDVDDDGCLGTLWVLHLGLDAFELAPLDLVVVEQQGEKRVLPARSMPSVASPVLPAMGALEAALDMADGASGPPWYQCWGTGLLTAIADGSRGACSIEVAGLLQTVLSAAHESPMPSGGLAARVTRASGSQPRALHTRVRDRLRQIVRAAGDHDPVGVLATGPLSRALSSSDLGTTRLLEGMGLGASAPLWIEQTAGGLDAGIGRGLHRYLRHRAEGTAAYFDVLPKVEALVIRRGEPYWADLLDKTGSRRVDGGVPWSPPPLDLGLAVPKESDHIELTVFCEGNATVRSVKQEFPTEVAEETPVKLKISMTPGQGNPRVEVQPERPDVFGGRRFVLDWRRANDTGLNQEEAAERVPRTNPPLEPREASLAVWAGGDIGIRNARRRVEFSGVLNEVERTLRVLRGQSGEPLQLCLESLRLALMTKDENKARMSPPVHATAVSSEGDLAADAPGLELLGELRDRLDRGLADRRYELVVDDMIRVLGYTSAREEDAPNLFRLLRERVRRRAVDEYHLTAIANCFRDPSDIDAFARLALTALRANMAPNNWMRALGRILVYREDAARELESDLCIELTRYCHPHVVQQVEEGRLRYLFRHGSRTIVFLLRRRRYDDSYLPPDSPLALEVKETFSQAKALGEEAAIGGFVDLSQVCQLMIDYIDRRGRGRISMSE